MSFNKNGRWNAMQVAKISIDARREGAANAICEIKALARDSRIQAVTIEQLERYYPDNQPGAIPLS